MGRRTAVPIVAAAVPAVMLAMAASASAAKPITGKLNKSGYTVIALSENGRARTVVANRGRFRLKPPAKRVTLHLRAPNGSYAGPIVLRGTGGGKARGRASVSPRKGQRKNAVIVGVKAGARLGKIKVKPGKGFALARGVGANLLDTRRTAAAKKGVPIGAGNFGRVRVRKLKGPGADRDRDGIPTSLDIDDDGDLILDNLDRSTAARAAQAEGAPGSPGLFSSLSLSLSQTANADAGSTPDQIDAALPSAGVLQAAAPQGTTMELDCAGDPAATPPRSGLVYCSKGGTGRRGGQMFEFKRFPEEFDPDGDGFGTMTPPPGGDLLHGATSSQIKSGDLLIEHVTAGGGDESLCPPPPGRSSPSCTSYAATLQYVFATVPALVSYSDTAGNCAKVAGTPGACGTTFSYPVGSGAPGTQGNGFPVSPGPGGDVIVTLTFWRPQRRPIGGEQCLSTMPPCQWVDIGGLVYGTRMTLGALSPGGPFHVTCPQGAYSVPPGQPLGPPSPGATGLVDASGDQAASTSNTITYTVNLTQCTAGVPWGSGEEASLDIHAQGSQSPDSAQQGIAFKLS